MVDTPTLVLAALRLVVFALGVGVAWTSYRAYRRTGQRFLRDATVGFAVITVGVFVEGVLYTVFSLDLTTVHIVESLAVGGGLLVLHLSLRR